MTFRKKKKKKNCIWSVQLVNEERNKLSNVDNTLNGWSQVKSIEIQITKQQESTAK